MDIDSELSLPSGIMEPDPIVLQDESNQGVTSPGGDLHMTSWGQ